MRRSLEDYREIVGDEVISNIYRKARRLYGKHILHINSTFQGGGVAEMLTSLVPLMNDIGLEAGWRILHGNPDFFTITKKFHNALQGGNINLSEMKKQLYLQTNENFSTYTHIDHDCVFIHDPQPLALVKFYRKRQPWIWRCHIDLSNPNKELWDYVENFILRYDAVIFSSKRYIKKGLPVEQKIVYPAIDPLSLKNKELSENDMLKYIKKSNIPMDKPVIAQVSRMDRWKDPEGLLEVFKYVKEEIDCRLVYCYSSASDDPESMDIYRKVYNKAKKWVDTGDIIFVIGNNNILVNAIQRFADVIVQKSIKEGFCLAITEALWKEKPVIASNVGGIPLQIKDGENGFLLDPQDTKGFAEKIVQVLKHPEIGKEMGKKAKEVVKKKFLITRLLSDYLDILNEMIN